MAQTVVIGNQAYKKRNIVGVWLGLPFITLGIYSYVWIYKVNNEARRFLRDYRSHLNALWDRYVGAGTAAPPPAMSPLPPMPAPPPMPPSL